MSLPERIIRWSAIHPVGIISGFFVLIAVVIIISAKPRIDMESHPVTGDGFYYYCYARSLLFDQDVNFKNEYEQFGPVTMGKTLFPETNTDYGRWNMAFPEYPKNVFSIGSGLLWIPFLVIAHLIVLLLNFLNLASFSPDGYSLPYQVSVGIASTFFLCLGVYVHFRTLAKRFSAESAFIASSFIITTTAILNYVAYEPAYSHTAEFFSSSLVFSYFLKHPSFEKMSYRNAFLGGLFVGLCALIRWQTILWGIIPLVAWIRDIFNGQGKVSTLLKGIVLAVAVVVVFSPQSIAWRSIYGDFLTIPQGGSFIRLRLYEALLVLFSNNHGMFIWHPITLVGFIGALGTLRQRFYQNAKQLHVVIGAIVVFALMTIVNGMARDWWAGGSFGMRRMIGMYPLIGWGIAAILERFQLPIKRPATLCWVWFGASIWNLTLLVIWILHLGGRVFPH